MQELKKDNIPFPAFQNQGMVISSFTARTGDALCIKVGQAADIEEFGEELARAAATGEPRLLSAFIRDPVGLQFDTAHSWLTRAFHGDLSAADAKLKALGIPSSAALATLGGNHRRLLAAAAVPAGAMIVVYHLYGLDASGRIQLSKLLSDRVGQSVLVQVCLQSMPDGAIAWPPGFETKIVDACQST